MKLSHLIDSRLTVSNVMEHAHLTEQDTIETLFNAIHSCIIFAENEQYQRTIDIIAQQKDTIKNARVNGKCPIPLDSTARIQRIARNKQRAKERAIMEKQNLENALNSL